MGKFYLIPLKETSFYYKDESLNSCLKKVNKKIYEMENESDFAVHEKCMNELPKKQRKKYTEYLLYLEREYRKSMLPTQLIVYGDLDGVKEIVTGYEIVPEQSHSLMLREVEKNRAEIYYKISNYEECTLNFFERLKTRKEAREKFKVLKKEK